MYQGQVDSDNSFSHQVHDFNPGISPNGLFWTVPIPLNAVQIDLDGGVATLQVNHLTVADYTTVPKSLARGSSTPATVSFTVRWTGQRTRQPVRDAANGFTGEFVRNTATIEWTASTNGFTFTSDPAATSKSLVSLLGKERNGVFFT